MDKKPLNWKGYILVFAYVFGLFLFGLGIFRCVTYPESAIIQFFGGDVQGAIIIFSLFGFFLLTFGGVFVKLFYKDFAIQTTFKSCPEQKSYVKAVLKTCNNANSRNFGRVVTLKTFFFVVFQFPDGRRKNFRVLNTKVFNTIFENDTGILTYKEYGDHTLFIDFQRHS